ncbi:MAG: type II 3-dehydroquinate dehydratase [Lachnospiraceae bacterium]|nr:type II 3-dehydroquinate dehydratase [Lachnospiraceae bacterium]
MARPHLQFRIAIIDGPNLNMLGIREPEIYGGETLEDRRKLTEEYAGSKGIAVTEFQSNYEGAIVSRIQNAHFKCDGIVINPAALTHYSYAVLDALKAVSVPAVEVHISDIDTREEFRKISVTAPACKKQIVGKGFEGYVEAIQYLIDNYME